MMYVENWYTGGGSMGAMSLDVLCDFLIKSFETIKRKTTIQSFKKCGFVMLREAQGYIC